VTAPCDWNAGRFQSSLASTSEVQRCKAEAQDVGRAEVADHAARDQRLHHRPRLGMGEADLAAALRRVARRDQLAAKAAHCASHELG
jgi:hypothetical protein